MWDWAVYNPAAWSREWVVSENTPERLGSSQHRFRSKCWLRAYWKLRGNLSEMKPCGRCWERRTTYQSRAMRCHRLRHILTACFCRVVNNPARSRDVTCASAPMLLTGELQQKSTHPHAQNTRLASQWSHRRPRHVEMRMKYAVKWTENSWGLPLSVIRIILKWLIGPFYHYHHWCDTIVS